MPIVPLQQFEDDLKADLEAITKQRAEADSDPKTMVVRFGAMGLVAEYPYKGDATPGCGSKLVCRTHRGTELATMLTSTCPNAGCGSSVTRSQMLEYIDRSGGRDFPFYENGKVIRIATNDDITKWSEIEATKHDLLKQARDLAEPMKLDMKIVEIEPILGKEKTTIYFLAEHRIDFRELVRELSNQFRSRIEMRQIGARDEARLVADYERCGQYCCCKNFLKVLKPVSMRSAKTQKATLDPLKISGRCGRLMCCLRYEDETYESLRKKLPRRKSRVGTPEGAGIVLDTQILTQLVRVKLEDENRIVAIPVEELCDPDNIPPKPAPEPFTPITSEPDDKPRRKRRRRKPRRSEPASDSPQSAQSSDPAQDESSETKPKRRRRRRSGRSKPRNDSDQNQNNQSPDTNRADDNSSTSSEDKPKRRRRRRRPRGKGGDNKPGDAPNPPSAD
ncbi:MAG: PSP1 domain-containing protein [Planctomycetota bacterium]|jgi:cell fate regulator YaaT (PSP1 superfamily)